jgi:diguanylate cyclase (GGDEF)-like protein/PAS domain S-box-containing protein
MANIVVAAFLFLLYIDGKRDFAWPWMLSHVLIVILLLLGPHLDADNALPGQLLFILLGTLATMFMAEGALLLSGRRPRHSLLIVFGGGCLFVQGMTLMLSMRAALVTGLALHALALALVSWALLGRGRFYALAGAVASVRVLLLVVLALGVAAASDQVFYRPHLALALLADGFTLLSGLILVYAVYREAMDTMRAAKTRYRTLIERSPIGIVIHRGFELLFINKAYLDIFGYGSRAEFEAGGGLLRHIYPDNLAKEAMLHRAMLDGTRDLLHWAVKRQISSIGDVFLSVTSQRIDWEGEPAEQSLIIDETDRLRAETALRARAIRDDLTGLCNRAYLVERLNALVRQKEHFALLLMDLNRFKWINDTYGHTIGDRLLREIGLKLSGMVGPGEAVVRPGGDEFAILVVGEEAEVEAQILSENIIRATRDPILIDGYSLHHGVAIGIALHPTDAADAMGLMRCADLAMYAAKSDGAGSGFRFFDAAMNRRSQARMHTQEQLHGAMENGRVSLYYQPKVDAISRKLAGFEALLRIVAPDGTICAPAPFIAVAEDTGLIHGLGAIVQRTVCRQVAEWERQFGWSPKVSFNASLSELGRPGFDRDLLAIVAEAGVSPDLLEVEVTESATGQSMTEVSDMLHRLAARGIQSALDDFGTGYSSLGRLHELPIRVIKLDKCFVDRVPNESRACALAESVTRIGRSLDYELVAEGVETEAQAVFLKNAGYAQLQGYLFSRPLPPAEATDWVREAAALRFPARLSASLAG